MLPEPFTICTPEQFLSPPAQEGTVIELPQNLQKRIIEPDDHLCFWPDKITDLSVIPGDDPAIWFCLLSLLAHGHERPRAALLVS
jgi:hypothetical protein